MFLNLMAQLDDHNIPFWAFDIKGDYRHLVKSDEVDDLLVLPVDKFRFNPLRSPPGVSRGDWMSAFMTVFADTQELLGGSDRFIDQYIYPFMNETEQPTLLDLMNYLENTSVHPQLFMYKWRVKESIGRTIRDAPHTFNVVEGYNIEDLLQRNVVFEFQGLKKWTQNFLMEILIAWVYRYREAQTQRNQGLHHATFLDEGKEVLSKFKEDQVASGIPEVDKLVAKMREFGEGLIVADQEATKLTESIDTNTSTKVLLPTSNQKEFESIAESLKMDHLQKRSANFLSVGEAVIQIGGQEPVRAELPDFDLKKDVTDDELVSYMSDDWRELSFQPLDSSTSRSLEPAEKPDEDTKNQSNAAEEAESEVSEEAERLLKDIVDNPFKSVTERYESFSSRYKGDKAKKELIEKGLVEEQTASLEQGRVKLFEVTDQGEEFLEDLGVDVERSGRGGVVHRYWQHRVSERLEKDGLNPVVEKSHADVFVNVDGDGIAVEIAMGRNTREVEHISDRLENGFDRVVTLCRNKSVKGFIEEKVGDVDVSSDQVDVLLLRQFFDADSPL